MASKPSAEMQRHWARELRHFTYCPSPGGHGDCPETLSATIPYRGLEELLATFVRLGRPLCRLPADAPVPEPGKSYRGDEWAALKHPISAWPDYEDPGLTTLLNIECMVSIAHNQIAIHLSGGKDRDFWSVSETDFLHAKAMERAFDELGIRTGSVQLGQASDR